MPRLSRAGVPSAAALSILLAFAPASGRARASEGVKPPAIGAAQFNDEQACGMIRHALHELADAEREQAFALDLDPRGHGDTAMVQARLAILLDRSNRLRTALRIVHESRVADDERVRQCSEMGLNSLVQAERLTTTVEEVLYGPDLGNPLPGTALRSDAAPTAVAPPAR